MLDKSRLPLEVAAVAADARSAKLGDAVVDVDGLARAIAAGLSAGEGVLTALTRRFAGISSGDLMDLLAALSRRLAAFSDGTLAIADERQARLRGDSGTVHEIASRLLEEGMASRAAFARAALALLLAVSADRADEDPDFGASLQEIPPMWPAGLPWKPIVSAREALVVAGALVVIEIDRLDRADGRARPAPGTPQGSG